jgi:D-sedoheptulose 7-phosphate isomerase
LSDHIALVESAYSGRRSVVESFFTSEAERIASLCHLMARRFARGGRLIAFGVGAAATDAQHVSVEFVHPVIVGKRALPAIALPNDAPTALGAAIEDASSIFARSLTPLGGPEDIALGMGHSAGDPGADPVAGALKQAAAQGMLTVSLGAGEAAPDADFIFAVPNDDPFVVQEVHETLYHVLWELVHVFFEHKGLLDDRPPGSSHDSGRSSFLYPFLAEKETNLDTVIDDVRRSIVQKSADVSEMRGDSLDAEAMVETGRLLRERVAHGGKVLAFGNGGSATDAQDLVHDLLSPPPGLPPVPAISLTNDAAVVTAVANDVGFENVFARQVIAYGRPPDIAVAISTSGGSRNVLAAVEEAERRGLLTVALAGYGGGRLAEISDRAHTIDADYIPRIQEAQATQYHVLRHLIGVAS